ncbi:hypothetical protein DUNSADRAFT_6863 [Dunaliella salina]|uniref:Encoded protein n=1 Tax=Dunaliella salina TaxID=3046 RepID=A0ABQ7FTM5_DUNSA|nr:hypothetical protein DUNSADRAFT_6863 [Dunaliella salina]|eukprot:KAF5825802.1 hypothetical protein DUNSADRAFT_6863 [Dunaliella salina]
MPAFCKPVGSRNLKFSSTSLDCVINPLSACYSGNKDLRVDPGNKNGFPIGFRYREGEQQINIFFSRKGCPFSCKCCE